MSDAAEPINANPEPTAPTPGTDGTQTPSSPSGDGQGGEPAAEGGGEPGAEPTAEEAAAAAAEAERAVVPAEASGYKVNVSDKARPYLGADTDPAMAALRQFGIENGKPQGWFDDTLQVLEHFVEAGILGERFDPAAELAKLGENGAARQSEVDTFADSLKARGEISDGEHALLTSLASEADGVTLVEKIRKMMGPAGITPKAPGGEGGDAGAAAQEKAREMRRDARYETDRDFRKQADQAWLDAFSGRS